MPGLESLIEEINESGYLLSNLFQLTDRRWQANLRTAEGKLFFEYGRGASPYEALLQAFEMMGEGQEAAKQTSRVLINPVAIPAVSGASLLASLGLRKPVEIKL